MLKEVLVEFFERDLNKLKDELVAFKNEEDLWKIKGDVKNSTGNLFLHLNGNLNHFIGATLGNSGYIRERDKEFSSSNIPREKILSDLEKTTAIVMSTLRSLPEDIFEKNYPLEKHERIVKHDHMLLHLLTHLNYHLGQINYLRRLEI
ncbi:MAG: DUF1572 family protein [Bacteroidetes bacterium]|nr:DUF1572 family protein [Bacteroidota bacterium]